MWALARELESISVFWEKLKENERQIFGTLAYTFEKALDFSPFRFIYVWVCLSYNISFKLR